ncbi:hypothetical protein K435DRAFT_969407 [Dendrothele bispora CBS 962.96]|uniref:F-box domain-containing protein n=1 Tax=Dendrothele bispora (strain CBS 962.96) TaxID=1314807 RepID=A0A4V4HDV1_DENBC|nr:hypothetical protein K435DRAFT_969407 [Dendrothele bispora CBS 962.96]
MHTTLCTPELLRSIFKNLGRENNIQNALVCKKWSDVSLDVVWHDVHMRDLPAFFNLLAPIKLGSSSSGWTRNRYTGVWVQIDCWQYEFEQEPDANHWKRFFTRYCPRVHRLLLDHDGRELRERSLTTILECLRRNRPARPLLPKLKELSYHCGAQTYFELLDSLFVFMHEGLQKISISVPFPTNTEASAFFESLPFHSPNLTHFEFRCIETDQNRYEEALIECLGSLPSLSTVVLPSIPDGSPIFTGLKSLKRFELYSFSNDGISTLENPMKHPLQPGALCGLEHLHLTVYYHLVTASLLAQGNLPDLKSVVICSPLMESPDAIKQLSSAIAKTCQNLDGNLSSDGLPSFLDIQPLLQCNEINDLKFTHRHALGYTSWNQLISFIQSFPNLKSLVLNPCGQPGTSGKPRVDPAVLLKFAAAVPKIEHIGIAMNFSVALPSDQELFPQGSFPYILRNLITLDVGWSTLKDGDEIRTAFFLSGILPRWCRILSHDSSIGAAPSTLKGWSDVQTHLPRVIERARLMNMTLDRLKESSSALKTVEEKLNESLSSNAILEQKLLDLTQELKKKRAKNVSSRRKFY